MLRPPPRPGHRAGAGGGRAHRRARERSSCALGPDADFEQLDQAIAEAAAGDEIRIRPGRYTASIAMTKPLTLRGEGKADEIIIEAAEAPSSSSRRLPVASPT
ncbi:MAG: hypothetical protein R3F43_22410 [bacterium]